jgi:hypothetical protein
MSPPLSGVHAHISTSFQVSMCTSPVLCVRLLCPCPHPMSLPMCTWLSVTCCDTLLYCMSAGISLLLTVKCPTACCTQAMLRQGHVTQAAIWGALPLGWSP